MNKKEFPQQANMSYPYPMPYQDSDEIDLVELLRTLWKQKAKIALITVVTTLAAGIYAFTAEEVWTSKAVIAAPNATEMGAFYQIAQEINRNTSEKTYTNNQGANNKNISNDIINKQNFINESTDGLSIKNLSVTLFENMKQELGSINQRKQFLIKNKALSLDIEGKSAKELKILLNEMADKKIIITQADDVKKKMDEISFSAETPEKAKYFLDNYISEVNVNVINKNVRELELLRKKINDDLTSEANMIDKSVKQEWQRKKDVLYNNMLIAKKMKMEAPSANLSQQLSEDVLYLLGSSALQAKLDILNLSKPNLPVRYFEIQEQLKQLRKISFNRIDGKAFSYVDAPDEPVTKDQPKKALILILGLVLGFICGCIGILVLYSFEKE